MASQKEQLSDVGETEDIPSDFFDDFSKDDFMNGLSVIDSWNDDDSNRRRIDTETLDSVKDLRELIGDGRVEEKNSQSKGSVVKFNTKYKWEKGNLPPKRSESEERLDDFIKPGSRRDPNKTSEAIKKDKEEKVKEYLAKRLEFSDNLRPPGTELDDYYTENKKPVKRKTPSITDELTVHELHPREYKRSVRESPGRRYQSPQRSSRHSPRRSPQHSPRRSPQHSPHLTPQHSSRHSPQRSSRQSPHRSSRHSPHRSSRQSPQRGMRRSPRRSPRRNFFNRSPQHSFRHGSSPQRKFKRPMQCSPRRYSPQRRSPRHQRSRSPRRHYTSRHSRSPELQPRDSFLYPATENAFPPVGTYQPHPGQPYPGDYAGGGIPGYSYPQGPHYAGYSGPGYEYGMQPEVSVIPQPQPVPAPVMELVGAQGLTQLSASLSTIQTPVPEMVPPPSQMVTPASLVKPKNATKPYDALAQLVAEGKLSKEDYLKLAPNKGISNNSMDPKARILMLNRCNHAVIKLSKLLLPNRLLMNNNIIGQEPKCLENKYCSPLKRQPNVEFQFTKSSGSSIHQNKQLVDSIIATVGLDKVVTRAKKKAPRNMKDAACQTVRPHCDLCEVRESTKVSEASMSTDPAYFSTAVYTQVVEQDLISSKSVFNPTGSASTGDPISIAHLTPAQLVSQLAARAKTLKQTSDPAQPPNQFGRYNQPNSFDNRGQYQNNYNYRY